MHVFGPTQGKSSSVITITASESVCAFCNQRERVSSGLGREWVVSLLLFFQCCYCRSRTWRTTTTTKEREKTGKSDRGSSAIWADKRRSNSNNLSGYSHTQKKEPGKLTSDN